MPNKISIIDMRKWLADYESGKTEIAIARKARRDVRTIKRGIDLARREHDVSIARAEMVKEALHKHQSTLFETLEQILFEVVVPNEDSAELPWVPSIISQNRIIQAEVKKGKTDRRIMPVLKQGVKQDLLHEHLRGDPLWKVLAEYKKTLADNLEAKIAFQRKEVSLLKERTGYDVVDEQAAVGLPAVIYIDITGPLFFGPAIRTVLGIRDSTRPQDDITVDNNSGELKWASASILAKAPGKEDLCKKNMVAAFYELIKSDEATRVAETYRLCSESAEKAKKAVEEALLLGMVPGRCRICRRLGI